MKYSFIHTVKQSGFRAAALLLAASLSSVASAQAVLQIRAVADPVFEPAPAAPADPAPAPAQAPVRAVLRPAGIMPIVPSPAIVAPAPVTRVISVLNSAAVTKSGAFRATNAFLIAAPFPN